MSKMQNLQTALNRSTGRKAATPERVAVTAASMAARDGRSRPPGRMEQFNLSSWQPKAFKSSLRLVQARKGGDPTIQELMAEALNDLFIKYDVPTVNQK